MSTKIHHGYYVTIKDLFKLHAFSLRVKAELKAKANSLFKSQITRSATDVLDRKALGKNISQPRVEFDYDQISAREWAKAVADEAICKLRKSEFRSPTWDYETSWVFIPHKNKVLALFYTEQEELQKIWENQPEVKPYPYWDNTDEPKGISRKAWKARGKEWDEAIKGSPATSGFAFCLYSKYESPKLNNLGSLKTHSHTARCLKYAFDLARQEWNKTHPKDEDDTNGTGQYLDFVEFSRKPEGVQFMLPYVTQVAAILPEKYSMKDYTTKFSLTPRPKKSKSK